MHHYNVISMIIKNGTEHFKYQIVSQSFLLEGTDKRVAKILK